MIRIQVVGTQRSGSNLLRLILAAHDGVFAPPSTHMYRVFRDLVPRYGPLDVRDNRLAIIEDVRRLIDLNVFTWRAGVPAAEEIDDRWIGATVAGLFRAVYDAAAETAGMEAWVCKCLENVHYLPELIEATPGLAVVHLVRDGRDVALSFERVPVGPKHPYVAAREWIADQRAALSLERAGYAPFVRVRYEELIASPVDAVADLCGAVGLDFDRHSLEFHQSAEAQEAPERSPLWQNLDRPVIADNTGNFADPARRAFVETFEESAHDLLVELGYEPMYARCAHEPSEAEIERFLARDRLLRTATRRDADQAIEALHRPQEEFVRRLRSPRGTDP